MQLTTLRIQNFRCIADAELEPAAGINLVVGDNASGKSSLLEAIYFLGRAQSFRGTPRDRLIRTGENMLAVFGRLQNGSGPALPMGVQRQQRVSRIKIGNEDNASVLDLINTLPIQVIDPGLHQLLEDGPEQRRRYLDWGVFHVEPGFYPAWQKYQRAMRQRNSALRAAAPPAEIAIWNNGLVEQAGLLDRARRQYLESLTAILPQVMASLFEDAAVSIEYHAGWPEGEALASVLEQGIERDRELGYTHHGPHRADLKVRLKGKQARTRASRGEQKLISAGLLLAQAELVRRHQDRKPILLIDDLAAELDARSRQQLFNAIHALGTQCFLSFLEPSQIPQAPGAEAMFHVEHGRVMRRG